MLLSRFISTLRPAHLVGLGGACGASALAAAWLVGTRPARAFGGFRRLFRLSWVSKSFSSMQTSTAEAEEASSKGKSAASALDPNEWRSFKLQSIDTGGPPNTNRYRSAWHPPVPSVEAVTKKAKQNSCRSTATSFCCRFALPDAEQEVGLPVASCLVTR